MKVYNNSNSSINIDTRYVGLKSFMPGEEIDLDLFNMGEVKNDISIKNDLAKEYAKGVDTMRDGFIAGFEAAKAMMIEKNVESKDVLEMGNDLKISEEIKE